MVTSHRTQPRLGAPLRTLRRALGRPGPLTLLVSDVDDTLVGCSDDDLEALAALADDLASAPRLRLALNSSRPCASVRGTLDALPVAVPFDALVGAMGTEIEVEGRRLAAWSDRFAGWDRALVDRVLADLGEPHADEYQTALKASYAIPPALHDEARRRLEALGQPTRIVVSGESDFDAMPRGADKGTATRFLASFFGVPLTDVIAAGDSGNDVALFAAAGSGIVVGNAREELRQGLRAGGVHRRVYHARARCAEGLREGLRALGVLEPTAVAAT